MPEEFLGGSAPDPLKRFVRTYFDGVLVLEPINRQNVRKQGLETKG
jgi:hypothetical protein